MSIYLLSTSLRAVGVALYLELSMNKRLFFGNLESTKIFCLRTLCYTYCCLDLFLMTWPEIVLLMHDLSCQPHHWRGLSSTKDIWIAFFFFYRKKILESQRLHIRKFMCSLNFFWLKCANHYQPIIWYITFESDRRDFNETLRRKVHASHTHGAPKPFKRSSPPS